MESGVQDGVSSPDEFAARVAADTTEVVVDVRDDTARVRFRDDSQSIDHRTLQVEPGEHRCKDFGGVRTLV